VSISFLSELFLCRLSHYISPRNQCLLRYGRCSCDLYSRCFMWFQCVSTQLSARHTDVRTMPKIPGFTLISWRAFSARCCNTSVTDRCWTHQSLQLSPQPNIQRIKVRRSCRPVDWVSASHPLFTESLVQVLCDSAEKTRWCPTMHEPLVIDEETYVPRVLVNHIPKRYWDMNVLIICLGTSSVYWSQLSRFYLKTETECSLRNVVF
jgi:hypothetical protein